MTRDQKPDRKYLDLAEMRQNLVGKKGRSYWRSLEELAGSEDFEEIIREEFPRQASLLGGLNRRDFIKILGASMALAGLTACAPQSQEKILPYTKPPEELIPGKSVYFASAMVQDGVARGVLIETREGRPIKVEGNPLHPDSMGATDAFMQASVLELYDPERAQAVTKGGAPAKWEDFAAAAGGLAGAGLRILSGPVTSPSLTAQIQALLDANAGSVWYQYSPVRTGNASAGAQMAGQVGSVVYDFAKADVVLSLDCDFLFMEEGHLRYARDFKSRHRPLSENGVMSRLYVVEASSTLTGANADHRLAVKPSEVELFARAVAAQLGVAGVSAPSGGVPGASVDWIQPLAADLKRAGAAALVVAGERQPPAVHAIANAMNQALGSVGTTVLPAAGGTASGGAGTTPVAPPDAMTALSGLVDELNGGNVTTLVIIDGNPVYTAPADLKFADAMQKAANRVYLGYYNDETAALATWFIPLAHYMEMWGDARAFDGTVSIIQPVIEPLYGAKSPWELVAALQGNGAAKGYDLVRNFWTGADGGGLDDRAWRQSLSRGIGPAAPAGNAGGAADTGAGAGQAGAGNIPAQTKAQPGELELVFEPDYTIWDGRFSNNAWLQELPKPLTKLVWDNAAFISPATAEQYKVKTGDVVRLNTGVGSADAAVFVQPGQPDGVVVVTFGYGRTGGGTVHNGGGFNAYALRSSKSPWFTSDVRMTPTGGTYQLVSTQEHWVMEDRELIREATADEFQQDPNFAHHGEEEGHSLYGEWEYNGYAWGMSVNLNTCIGCNACVIACQAENNIPTTGKDQVSRSREMHWLRIDRYYVGPAGKPRFAFQPMLCQHCEKAPCEPVCPVEATSHSAEGLNEMTYNRCVGTRYCSNNCPYKVRRFNFFKYIDDKSESMRALRNPDVTVRSRGVMEKCTYCVQRINEARIGAEIEGREIRDGEFTTACAQACPTRAIVFGNINDENSQVRKLKETPLDYSVLGELNTQPRTTYMAKVRNVNPAIPEAA